MIERQRSKERNMLYRKLAKWMNFETDCMDLNLISLNRRKSLGKKFKLCVSIFFSIMNRIIPNTNIALKTKRADSCVALKTFLDI